MKSRSLHYLAVILVNLGILAAIELGSALFIHKHYKKANADFRRASVVEHPFAIPTGYEMRANAVVGDLKGNTRIRTDEKGHSIVPDPLPSPRFTLAVLGGSAMFGVGVTDNAATVPAQLQTLLRREYGLEVNVINLSARGYVSLQELLVLNHYLAEQPLDMVVSVSGYNDLIRYLKGDPHPSYVKHPDCEAVLLVRRVEAGNLVVSNFIPALRRISQTANLVALVMERRRGKAKEEWKKAMESQEIPRERLEKLKQNLEAPKSTLSAAKAEQQETPKAEPEIPKRTPSAHPPTFLDAHLANYAMMNAVCAVHHTPFKLFLQPSAYTKANLSPEEKSLLLKRDCSGSQKKFDSLSLTHKTYRAAFDALPKSFSFTDLADGFGQTNSTIYLDGCHYNEEGSILLARVIAADLAPIIRSQLAAEKSQP